jgi:hypothetical protein
MGPDTPGQTLRTPFELEKGGGEMGGKVKDVDDDGMDVVVDTGEGNENENENDDDGWVLLTPIDSASVARCYFLA